MKRLNSLLILLLTGLLISCSSCESKSTLQLTDEDSFIEDVFQRFSLEKAPEQVEMKAVFLRKTLELTNSWKMIVTNDIQEIYLTPTLDVYNPFFITLWSEYSQCFGVIDYIPQTHPITVLSQNANAMIITIPTTIPGETQFWIFFINDDGNLEWFTQIFDSGGTNIEGTAFSMYFEPSNVDLQTLTYCDGESAP